MTSKLYLYWNWDWDKGRKGAKLAVDYKMNRFINDIHCRIMIDDFGVHLFLCIFSVCMYNKKKG